MWGCCCAFTEHCGSHHAGATNKSLAEVKSLIQEKTPSFVSDKFVSDKLRNEKELYFFVPTIG